MFIGCKSKGCLELQFACWTNISLNLGQVVRFNLAYLHLTDISTKKHLPFLKIYDSAVQEPPTLNLYLSSLDGRFPLQCYITEPKFPSSTLCNIYHFYHCAVCTSDCG